MQQLGNVQNVIQTNCPVQLCTWLNFLPEWKAILVTNWLDVEERGRVPRVRWPAVQLHLTAAASCVHHHSIVVYFKTLCVGGGEGVHVPLGRL